MATYNVCKAPFSIHGLYHPEDGAPYVRDFSHMPRTGAAYFDLYANGEHIHAFLPTEPTPTENGVILESMMYLPFGGMRNITIHFPSYNDINDVSLALDENATVLPPTRTNTRFPSCFTARPLHRAAVLPAAVQHIPLCWHRCWILTLQISVFRAVAAASLPWPTTSPPCR